MAFVHMVRHGRASAGWDDDPDPGIDELGCHQAERMADVLAPRGPFELITSPMLRCRETAAVLGRRWGSTASIQPSVGEIPSPHGVRVGGRVDWLRRAMVGTWSQLGPLYTDFRDGVASFVRSIEEDTVIASHFVAINAVVGAAIGDDRVVILRLDNCSITTFEIKGSTLRLVEGGHEADTLIR